MTQPSASLESSNLGNLMNLRWHGMGLKGKIIALSSMLLVSSALLITATVYHFTGRSLRDQLEARAVLISTNLSDVAAAELMAKNTLELHALATKYARIAGVAYVYIRDAKGGVAAHSLGTFPPELAPADLGGDERVVRRRTLSWRGKEVIEIRSPILEGQLGSVYAGMWADSIRAELNDTLWPQIFLIFSAVAVAILVSMPLAARIIAPVLGLRAIADRISRGDLDAPVHLQDNNEIGDLSASLERMRASLKAAMSRLKAD